MLFGSSRAQLPCAILSAVLRPSDPSFWMELSPWMFRNRRRLLLGWLPVIVLVGGMATQLRPSHRAIQIFSSVR